MVWDPVGVAVGVAVGDRVGDAVGDSDDVVGVGVGDGDDVVGVGVGVADWDEGGVLDGEAGREEPWAGPTRCGGLDPAAGEQQGQGGDDDADDDHRSPGGHSNGERAAVAAVLGCPPLTQPGAAARPGGRPSC